MIKLSKLPKPPVLEHNAENWTADILNAQAGGGEPSSYQKAKYNNSEIKETLKNETHGKCAYCESKILHISYGDIEHVVPKKSDPELWFAWENLTLACTVCNNKKRDNFPHGEGLVDPYSSDVEGAFVVLGPLLSPAPGNDDAYETERTLELNRAALFEQRIERIEKIKKIAAVAAKTEKQSARKLLLEELSAMGNPDQEYSAMSSIVASELAVLIEEQFKH